MSEGTKIRIGALEGYRDLVSELGGDPSLALKTSGLNKELWQTPEVFIPTEQYRLALNVASQLTNVPHYGLLLSQRQSLLKFGALGYVILNSPDLRTALNYTAKYLLTHDTGTVSSLLIEDGIATMTHKLAGVGTTSTIQQTELGVGLVLKFIRTTIGPEWTPSAVYFEHSRPKSTVLHQRIFQCPVYFDNDQSGIEFNANDLDRPIISADPKLYTILKSYVEELINRSEKNIAHQVRALIMNALEDGYPYIDSVAKKLSFSRSELQRHLKRENTSYQKLVEEVRYGVARKYLMDTDLSLSTITAILSYSDPAVFTRAFKRQAGTTPRDWRAHHKTKS